LPWSPTTDFDSQDLVVAVVIAVPLADVRLFLVGLGDSDSDKGAEGGGGVGSAVFGLVVKSSSWDEESELKSEELESETSLFVPMIFFALFKTSALITGSLEVSPELEESSLGSSFLFFSDTCLSFFPFVFTSSSLELELDLELELLLCATFTSFLATSSSESGYVSESDVLLEASVLLDLSGEGCCLGIVFTDSTSTVNPDFFPGVVEDTIALMAVPCLVESESSIGYRSFDWSSLEVMQNYLSPNWCRLIQNWNSSWMNLSCKTQLSAIAGKIASPALDFVEDDFEESDESESDEPESSLLVIQYATEVKS
jgi:hypothetical protein